MGQDVTRGAFSREDRARYRHKVRRCLDVFALMLNDFRFDSDRPTTGLEIEVNLIDPDAQPAMRNAEILADLADPSFQTELGQFNLEINVAPRLIGGDGLEVYEREVLASLVHADERAHKSDARLVLIGILPTLRPEHLVLANMSNDPRYRLLNDQIINARGEDIALDIRGHERLEAQSDSIAGESACTSVQFHLQVAPEDFARYWNASQAIAGIQVAVGANSPFLFGKRLWAETRIALFEQATDTRPEELKAQGVRPRVWFGERWITSIFDLFEENVRYFPPLLPITEEEDPVAVLEAGGVPRLGELRLHNGTIYRWNRPVYDIMNGRPHLRVENRVLPAGPTVVDQVANAAFYFGLVRELCEQDRPIWTQMSFSAAEENFHVAAREGLDAQVWWPEVGDVAVATLVLDELLPLAAAGLDRFGVDPATRDRLLGVIEGRCRTGQNGATWQTRVVQHFEEHEGLDRQKALQKMLQRYAEGLHENVPVHTWPV
ncbi:glutamate-cysteine ligase family protein [Dactylosporangium matsuzakiense]|uniref:Glutamate--cysteine ligase n=1 Tax=Dactylosporangium matsuzakiense TaxID=53360 RepID=A0A9W6NJG6_9ACTN|nr:glutamate-cysteine ligase family protein [Dactylosporangium matsuzakiense]UWZ45038.1 glutamate--cysteine ligase [Dactylosporangium matsuzakiense]GLK99035.1 glutamate--cysteine ligase [Dactylosporangium matsuzakiense]